MARFDPASPFNKLPDLPPEKDIESRDILKKAISAHRALSKLNASFKLLPQQFHLINSLVLSELESSAYLAEIKFERKELFTASSSEAPSASSKARTIFNLQDALLTGYQLVRETGRIDMGLLMKTAGTIVGTANPLRSARFQVAEPAKGEIVFTSPEGEELIEQKLKNLEAYLNSGSDPVEVLVRMAVAHYQFSTLCPFQIANGRIGRVVSILFLGMNDLLDWPVLYLSQYLKQKREAYYAAMNRVRSENKWKPWIFFMVDAIEKAAGMTRYKLESVDALIRNTEKFLLQKAPELYSKDLLDIISSRPYCKRQFLEDGRIVKKKTAGLYLARLEEIGLMESVRVGKEKLYLNKDLMDILDSH